MPCPVLVTAMGSLSTFSFSPANNLRTRQSWNTSMFVNGYYNLMSYLISCDFKTQSIFPAGTQSTIAPVFVNLSPYSIISSVIFGSV